MTRSAQPAVSGGLVRVGGYAFPALHALLVAIVALVLLPDRIVVDDAYITFRYAENLLAGHGLVYNPGEPFLGTSTPLFALALALIGWVTGASTFQAVVVLHVAALVALALLAYGLFRGQALRPLGLLLPYLLVSHQLLIQCFGMESLVFAVAGVAVIYCYLRQRPIVCGVAASTLCLLRPDGIFLILPLLILAWCDKRWMIKRMAVTCIALAAGWIVFAWIQGVSPMPDTVGAKLGQAGSGLWPGNYGKCLVQEVIPGYLGWWVGPIVVALYWAFARRDRLALAVGLWLVVSVGVFVITAVPSYWWYYVPLLVQGSLLATWLAVRACSPVLEGALGAGVRRASNYAVTAVALAVVATTAGGWSDIGDHLRRDAFAPRANGYYRLGRWLDKHAPADAKVASIEVGMIGYYGRRYVVDFLGLVTPGISQHVAHRLNVDEAMIRHRPDFLVLKTHMDGHSSVAPQYVLRAYDPVLQHGGKLLLKRKPRDEASLAAKVVGAVGALAPAAGAATVYFGDFPAALEFDRFRELAERALPGVRFTKRPPADTGARRFVVQLQHDDSMRIVPYGDALPVTFDRRALATWKHHSVSVKPGNTETRFRVKRPWGYLFQKLDLPGPIRRIRIRLKVLDLAGRRGAEGRVHYTTGEHAVGEPWPWFGFTIRANPALHDLVIHFPSGGIRAGETLHALRLDLGDRRGELVIESISLERA